jgi:hypothetical protein
MKQSIDLDIDKLQANMILEHTKQYRDWKYKDIVYNAELDIMRLCFNEFRKLIETNKEETK